MNFLSVNFHYIGDEEYPNGGIYPLKPEKFRSQLKALGGYFDFVGLTDIEQAIKGGKDLPERSCLITFDDGLRCQYEQALPVLEELGIPAGFFVNGLPLFESRACAVHKIHQLRAKVAPREFYGQIDGVLRRLYGKGVGGFMAAEDYNKASAKYRYDDREGAATKYLLNSLLSDQQKEEVVGVLFREHFPDEQGFCRGLYLSERQVTDLGRRGWLGIHTYSHKPLALLGKDDLAREIGNFKNDLERRLGINVGAISYPYGSALDINSDVLKACEEAGLLFGFTMERAMNRTLREPLVLARVDTNDAPGGKSPLFRFEDGSAAAVRTGFGPQRELFFKEGISGNK